MSDAFRIARLDVYALEAKIATPVTTSFGSMPARVSALLRIEDTDGHAGWGELWGNFPSITCAYRATLACRVLPEPLLGAEVETPGAFCIRLADRLRVLAVQSAEPGADLLGARGDQPGALGPHRAARGPAASARAERERGRDGAGLRERAQPHRLRGDDGTRPGGGTPGVQGQDRVRRRGGPPQPPRAANHAEGGRAAVRGREPALVARRGHRPDPDAGGDGGGLVGGADARRGGARRLGRAPRLDHDSARGRREPARHGRVPNRILLPGVRAARHRQVGRRRRLPRHRAQGAEARLHLLPRTGFRAGWA